MLQDLNQSLHSSPKCYSLGLKNKNNLIYIPWTVVDGGLNLQRLTFIGDNSLYIIKEEKIQVSKWKHLSSMNSLVVEGTGKKIMMNEVFANGKALILENSKPTSAKKSTKLKK